MTCKGRGGAEKGQHVGLVVSERGGGQWGYVTLLHLNACRALVPLPPPPFTYGSAVLLPSFIFTPHTPHPSTPLGSLRAVGLPS